MEKEKNFSGTRGTVKRWLLLTMLALLGFGQGAWAEERTLTSDGNDGFYINMPKTGTDNLTIPSGITSFNVYDDGGKDGNYSDKCAGTLVLTAPTGYVLQLTGTVTTERNFDYLQVHDGSSTSATQLGEFSSSSSGAATAITTCQSSGTTMTLYFKSDGNNNYAGLDLTVTLISATTPHNISINTATGGSVAATVGGSSAETATAGQTVTLTATPTDGYLLSGITVKDASNNAVAVTGGDFINNTATFTMPGSSVTVTPKFTNNLTAADGLYLNMPKTGAVSTTIPSGVTSFKVYDDGGSSNNYSNNCNGTLVLTAPEGYVLQVSGTVTTEDRNCDCLQVHDGGSTSAAQLGMFYSSSSSSSSGSGTATNITTCMSSGTQMTLYFKSDNSYNLAGLDLTVTVVDPTAAHNINGLGDATGGSVAATVGGSSATSAKVYDVVTLTATPSEGYLLHGITVTDESSNVIPVTDGSWYTTNTATFTMPGSAVTVTPTFTTAKTADGGLYINMPATGSKSVTIPSGVTSFKVYDDGGSSNNYSKNCNGTLVLTAPTGYVLQVTGSVTTERNYDYLQVHDGSSTSDTKLGEFSSSSSGAATAITTCQSSGATMTLYFYSDNNANDAGLNLTVTLISAADLAYASISGISESYLLTGEEIKPEPTVTDVLGNVLTKGTDYTLTWSGDGTTAGTYTVTATGTGNYSGTISKEYTVKDYALTINSADDWNTFATNVSGGTTYSGEFVKLGADITVSTMAGTSEANSFQGTFEGDGHTLTLSLSTESDNCAPFTMLKNATIQNLNIAGTINTSKKFGASIAALTYGTVNIRNCHSSVEITGTVSGDGTHGGFVGVNEGSATLNFENCLFTGKMLGAADSNGGFVGWNEGPAVNYTACLFAPAELTMTGGGTFNRNGKNTFTRCYYKQTFGEAQGTLATAEQLTSGELCYLLNGSTSEGVLAWYQNLGTGGDAYPVLDATHKVVLFDGTSYYNLADITLLNDDSAKDEGEKNTDVIAANAGETVNVTLSGRTLAKDGNWNTLCLPFALTAEQIAASELSGAKIKKLNPAASSLSQEGLLTLTFTDVAADETLVAGQPYIVKWDNASGSTTDLVFTGVQINAAATAPVTFQNAQGADCQFVGQFSNFKIGDGVTDGYDEVDNINEIVMLGANNQLGYSKNPRSLKAFRAHFEIPTSGTSGAKPVSNYVIDFGEGTPTSIKAIENGEMRMENSADGIYNLQGNRIDSERMQNGQLYIVNGKKVIIK